MGNNLSYTLSQAENGWILSYTDFRAKKIKSASFVFTTAKEALEKLAKLVK